eukprot:450357_1
MGSLCFSMKDAKELTNYIDPQQLKSFNCYCGNKQLNKRTDSWFFCANCSRKYESDTVSYWCMKTDCEFNEIIGHSFALCCHCYTYLPSMQSFDELMSLALETGRKNIEQSQEHLQSLNTYLCQFYNLVFLIIDNYYKHAKIPASVHKELTDKCNNIYQLGLKYVCNMMQQNQLKLNNNILSFSMNRNEPNQNDFEPEWSLKINTIRLIWYNIHENDKYNKNYITSNSNKECECIEKCIAVHRISYLLDLYSDYYISPDIDIVINPFIHIFTECLSLPLIYNVTTLINDFIHILDYHQNNQHLKELNAGNIIKLCNNHNCIVENRRV